MDVTNDRSVTDGVKAVLERAHRIDVLVNNAGYSLAGGLEETSLEEARQQFERISSELRVTHTILPVMWQRYGRIKHQFNARSSSGPYRGIYAASKHALEGYTGTLDHEVRAFGVRAVLVEPVFTKLGRNENLVSLRCVRRSKNEWKKSFDKE